MHTSATASASAKSAEEYTDEPNHHSSRRQNFRQRYFGGTRRTLQFFITLTSIVLIINLSWLAYAVAHYGINDGYGTIQRGTCSSVNAVNTGLHLAINIMSTLLLTASNTFMAVYCCPSRKEVDKAHRQRKSLQIGNLSLGNLTSIAKRKAVVVLILALSSMPFHLLYNSLVFTVQSANEYYWTITNENFLTGGSFNLTGDWWDGEPPSWPSVSLPNQSYYYLPNNYLADRHANQTAYAKLVEVMNEYFRDIQRSAPSWERLENKDCIQEYANLFVTTRRNLVLVSGSNSTESPIQNSILMYGGAIINKLLLGNYWICSETDIDTSVNCYPEDLIPLASSWSLWEIPIDYCLSQRMDDVCSVKFSLNIMLIVISFNALKLVMMTWVLCRFDAEKILIFVGDAAASFLAFEDETTVGMCLATKREIKGFWNQRGKPKLYRSGRNMWGFAVSRIRLSIFCVLMLVCFGTVSGLMAWGFYHVEAQGISLTASTIWRLGFGKVNPKTMVIGLKSDIKSLLMWSLLANAPQVVLAVIYILYMNIMTSVFTAADWSKFASEPLTLMVSSPVGKQRGTWLLGVPIGWGLALVALQVLLHWFVSQSIFIIQMSVFEKDGKPKHMMVFDKNTNKYSDEGLFQYSNCGYSPIAIICSLITAGLLVLGAVLLLCRKFPRDAPPVVSTSSAAISAACHPRSKTSEMIYEELRWGVDGGAEDEHGHCSLMAAENWLSAHLNVPKTGFTYAGPPSS